MKSISTFCVKRVFVFALAGIATLPAFSLDAQDVLAQTEIAAAPPTFLRMEISSACHDDGALFKIVNRGNKWPRTGFLKLYYADDKTMIGKRRLRLSDNQKVSFVVRQTVHNNRPVAVWVEPEWYKREFEFDATLKCANPAF